MGNLGKCVWPSCICDEGHCKFEDPDYYINRNVSSTPKRRIVQLDVVWVIAIPNEQGMLYTPPGKSPSEAWRNLEEYARFHAMPSWTKDKLHKSGHRARQVSVQYEVITTKE